MQTESIEDSLHEMSKPIFWKKKSINLSSAEYAQSVVKINPFSLANQKRYTPQPLYNTTVGVHSINHVS